MAITVPRSWRQPAESIHPTHNMAVTGRGLVDGKPSDRLRCKTCRRGRAGGVMHPALTRPCVERVLQFAQGPGFAGGRDLRPAHCDLLEAACLQNGDVPTLETVERARRAWPDAQDAAHAALVAGYAVYVNDAPRVPR